MEETPLPPLPHRAFKLKEVTVFNKVILQYYVENHLEGTHAFPKWDKAKRLMRTHAIEAWSNKVRARGKHLRALANRYTKLRIDLHHMPTNYCCRRHTTTALVQCTRSLQIATSKDMAMRKEAKWIQMSGKPNKDHPHTLNEEEAEELDKHLSNKELLAAIVASPKGKSPGVPYKC
jgi:hypothetical protein